MNYKSFALMCLVVALLLVTGGPAPVNARSAPEAQAAESLSLPGKDPLTLDPALASDVDSSTYLIELFGGLVTLDKNLQVVPDIAEAMPDVSSDGTTYTFQLRDDVVFSGSGRKVTAQDFKYSFERACDPKTNSPTADTYLGDIVGCRDKLHDQASEVSGVTVLDDSTLQLTIDAPKAYFLAKLTYQTAFVVDREQIARNPDNWTRHPDGTGPFILEQWNKGQSLTLLRNASYHLGVPTLAEVDFQLGVGSGLTYFEDNGLDLASVGPDDIERVRDPNNSLHAELHEHTNLSIGSVAFNTQKAPFDDPMVRQAFAEAIDKQSIASTVLKNEVDVASGILPPGMPGYNKDLQGLPYDPNAAQQLLQQSKYAGNMPQITLTITGTGRSPDSETSAVIEMWKQNLGINVAIQQEQTATFHQDARQGKLQMWEAGWSADYPDPQDFLSVNFSSQSQQNESRYNNPQVDQLLQQADTESDQSKRMSLYDQAEQIIVDDAPWIPLDFAKDEVLIKPYVQGYDLVGMAIPILRYVAVQGLSGVNTGAGVRTLQAVACPSSDTCFAVGHNGANGVVVPITNGIPGSPSTVAGAGSLSGIACPSSFTCIAAGDNGNNGVVVPITSGIPGSAIIVPGTYTLDGIACTSSTACLAVGMRSGIAKLSGVVVPITNGSPGSASAVAGTGFLGAIACTGNSTCFAEGFSTAFQQLIVPTTDGVPGSPITVADSLNAIACPTSDTCYAVGDDGTNGAAVPISNGSPGSAIIVASTSKLTDITCPSSTTCVTLGDTASGWAVVTITNGNPGSPSSIAGKGNLTGIACPASTTCFAVGDNDTSRPPTSAVVLSIAGGTPGSVSTVADVTSLGGIACSDSNDCNAVGFNVDIRNGNAGEIVPVTNGVPGSPIAVADSLFAIACPASATCFAVGSNATNGIVLPIAGGVPGNATVAVGTGSLNGIACFDSNECYAVGSSRVADANASGGSVGVVVPLSNGSPGSPIAVAGTASLDGIACPSSTCFAVGRAGDFSNPSAAVVSITSGAPGSPSIVAGVQGYLFAIACPDSSNCYAVGGNGSFLAALSASGLVVPITNGVPSSGATVTGLQTLEGIACPDSADCYVVGGYHGLAAGMVQITSGNVGNATALPGLGSVDAIGCPVSDTCYAVGQTGLGNSAGGVVIPVTVGTGP